MASAFGKDWKGTFPTRLSNPAHASGICIILCSCLVGVLVEPPVWRNESNTPSTSQTDFLWKNDTGSVLNDWEGSILRLEPSSLPELQRRREVRLHVVPSSWGG